MNRTQLDAITREGYSKKQMCNDKGKSAKNTYGVTHKPQELSKTKTSMLLRDIYVLKWCSVLVRE